MYLTRTEAQESCVGICGRHYRDAVNITGIEVLGASWEEYEKVTVAKLNPERSMDLQLGTGKASPCRPIELLGAGRTHRVSCLVLFVTRPSGG